MASDRASARVGHPALGGQSQRRDRELVLAGEAQESAARDEHAEPGGHRQQPRHERGGVQEVLKVVQDQQDLSVPKVSRERLLGSLARRLRNAEGVGDLRCEERGLRNGGEGHEMNPLREGAR